MTPNAKALDLPYEEAIAFFRQKAKIKTNKWSDILGAAHARAFMVAGAASQDLVDDFYQAIDKAIANGTTIDEFRKDFDHIVAKNGWSGWTGQDTPAGRAWRQEIIYDTNLRSAYAAGRWSQFQDQDVKDSFPYLQYHHSGSLHPRHTHLAWDGTVLKADDPWWYTNYPPNGWHCGCYVTAVSRGGLKRMGKTQADDTPKIDWVTKQVDGKKIKVPEGVDVGFDYNAGAAWLSRTAPGRETIAAAPGLIERFAEASMKGQIATRTYIPAALAPKALTKTFNLTPQSEMRLSADTIARHLHHPEATPAIYAEIVEYAVSEGEIYQDDKGRISIFVYFKGRLWEIGNKKNRNNEIYVTTAHLSRESRRKRLERVGTLLSKRKK